MKRIGLIVAVLGLIVVTSAMAATNVFSVTKFRGVITEKDGSRLNVDGSDISTNNVEMFVSDNLGSITVRKISGTTTSTLFDAYVTAFTAGGKFNGDMEGGFTPSNTNVPPFNGDLQFTGKLSPAATPKKVSGTLQGVWRNTTNDATFKGTISGTK